LRVSFFFPEFWQSSFSSRCFPFIPLHSRRALSPPQNAPYSSKFPYPLSFFISRPYPPCPALLGTAIFRERNVRTSLTGTVSPVNCLLDIFFRRAAVSDFTQGQVTVKVGNFLLSLSSLSLYDASSFFEVGVAHFEIHGLLV